MAYCAAFEPIIRNTGASSSGDCGKSSRLLSRGRSFWWIIVVPRDNTPTEIPDPDILAAVCEMAARSAVSSTRTSRAVTPCSSMPAISWRSTSACGTSTIVLVKCPAKAGDSAMTTSSGRVPRRAGPTSWRLTVRSAVGVLMVQPTSVSGLVDDVTWRSFLSCSQRSPARR